VVREPLVADHGMLRVRTVVPDPELMARYEVPRDHEVMS
jgi:hypothetical protein